MAYGTAYNSLTDSGKCSPTTPSGCVSYEGHLLQNLTKEEVMCRPSINEIFLGLDAKLFTVRTSVDLTKVNGQGLPGVPTSLFELERMKLYELLNLMLVDMKKMRDQINAMKIGNIMEMQVEIDLSCLNNAQCQNRTSFKFGEVLQILVAQACK